MGFVQLATGRHMPISVCHAVPEPFRNSFLHFILLVLPGSEDEDGLLDRPAVGGVSWRHKEIDHSLNGMSLVG